MAEPINLNKARKARAKAEAKAKGAQNRDSVRPRRRPKRSSPKWRPTAPGAKLDQAKRED